MMKIIRQMASRVSPHETRDDRTYRERRPFASILISDVNNLDRLARAIAETRRQ